MSLGHSLMHPSYFRGSDKVPWLSLTFLLNTSYILCSHLYPYTTWTFHLMWKREGDQGNDSYKTWIRKSVPHIQEIYCPSYSVAQLLYIKNSGVWVSYKTTLETVDFACSPSLAELSTNWIAIFHFWKGSTSKFFSHYTIHQFYA